MKNRFYAAFGVLLLTAMLLSACGGAAAEPEETTVEETAPEEAVVEEPEEEMSTVGTAENPIQVMFVPSADADELITGGTMLADVLNEATGYEFEVIVPNSYAATLEEMCANTETSMGFIPGLGYTLANALCGVEVAAKGERFGYLWYSTSIYVLRDSGIETLADLEGLTWAAPSLTSTSGYLYPLNKLNDAGITPGEIVEFGGSATGVVRAVYNGEVDFGTSFYSPGRVDGVAIEWEPGDDPDIPAELVEFCANTEGDSTVLCGNFEPRDARRNLRKEVPDVMQQVRVLDTTEKITNDTLSFGPDFPEDIRDAIMAALFAYAADNPDDFGIAMDPYSWSSIVPAEDAEYDGIRAAVNNAGFSIENLGE
jgi:phosphonate transport system substrate-binding protein